VNRGLFISFEGTEGSGKTTQIQLLLSRLEARQLAVRLVREPGGTPIGEEIRNTLQHSAQNHSMTAEAELLLINASRAQLVREVIRPALLAGEIVVCDRFFDSTIAYQAYGRGLDIARVREIIDFAVGPTRPNLTVLLFVPLSVSESRRAHRQLTAPGVRDRMEEADREFFLRVERGYREVAALAPDRVAWVDATQEVETVASAVWQSVEPLLKSEVRGV
jgi:dTMP kinase